MALFWKSAEQRRGNVFFPFTPSPCVRFNEGEKITSSDDRRAFAAMKHSHDATSQTPRFYPCCLFQWLALQEKGSLPPKSSIFPLKTDKKVELSTEQMVLISFAACTIAPKISAEDRPYDPNRFPARFALSNDCDSFGRTYWLLPNGVNNQVGLTRKTLSMRQLKGDSRNLCNFSGG